MNLLFPRHSARAPASEVALAFGHPLLYGALIGAWYFGGNHVGRAFELKRHVPPSVGGAPTSVSSPGGRAIGFPAITDDLQLLPDDTLLPTDSCTVVVRRRKRDTTARASTTFGMTTAGGGAGNRLGAHIPYSDGIIYLDFGGTTAPNRLTWSGHTRTTEPETWVFVAGRRGSAIYLNGIQRASQTTAITRSNGASVGWSLNDGNGLIGEGDIQDVHYVVLLNAEWTPTDVWSHYTHQHAVFQSPVRRWNVNAVVGGAAGQPIFKRWGGVPSMPGAQRTFGRTWGA